MPSVNLGENFMVFCLSELPTLSAVAKFSIKQYLVEN